jgi:hypothetical protein
MKSIFIFLVSCLAFSTIALAQCPFGNGTKINCVYGCGRFIDGNDDGFCDNGKVEIQTPIKEAENESSLESDKTKIQPTEIKKEKSLTKKEFAISTQELTQIQKDSLSPATNELAKPKSKPANAEKPYPLLLISAVVLICYCFTMLLVKLKKIRKITHRRIWNVVLLISFVGSCFGGFYLVAQLNYHFRMELFPLYLKIHVWAGIVMTLVGLIHILWHITYFKRMLSSKKEQK